MAIKFTFRHFGKSTTSHKHSKRHDYDKAYQMKRYTIRKKILNGNILRDANKGLKRGKVFVRCNDFYNPYQICEDLMRITKNDFFVEYHGEHAYLNLYWVILWEVAKKRKTIPVTDDFIPRKPVSKDFTIESLPISPKKDFSYLAKTNDTSSVIETVSEVLTSHVTPTDSQVTKNDNNANEVAHQGMIITKGKHIPLEETYENNFID